MSEVQSENPVAGLNRLDFDEEGILHVEVDDGAVVLARIMSGMSDGDFESLQWKTRPTAFVMDQTSLRALDGKSALDCLYQIGFLPEAVERDVKAGRQYKLLVFQPDSENGVVPADYENCIGLISSVFPQVTPYLNVALPILQQYAGRDGLTQLEGFAQNSGITRTFTDIYSAGSQDPDFMTVDRFLERVRGLDTSTEDGAMQLCVLARMFLYHTAGLFRLYAGDGLGRVETSPSEPLQMGSLEYYLKNMSLDALGAKRLLDLPINNS